MTFNPQDISNAFRQQSLMDAGLNEAATLLHGKTVKDLTDDELKKCILIYLETGQFKALQTHAIHLLGRGACDIEARATAYYGLAVMRCVQNKPSDGIFYLFSRINLNEVSKWLQVNVLKNKGIMYLNLKRYREAGFYFKQAYEVALKETTLMGLLPDLYSCLILTNAHYELATETNVLILEERLEKFEKGYETFKVAFKEKGILEEKYDDSHDYLAHYTRYAIILSKVAEKFAENRDARIKKAKAYFQKAVTAYKKMLPNDAPQIIDIEARLAALDSLYPKQEVVAEEGKSVLGRSNFFRSALVGSGFGRKSDSSNITILGSLQNHALI